VQVSGAPGSETVTTTEAVPFSLMVAPVAVTEGGTLVMATLAKALALAAVPSSSVPEAVTVLLWVEGPSAFGTVPGTVKVLEAPGARVGPPPLAAVKAGSRSPRWVSPREAMVTGSVLAGLVFVSVKL
jgi:hypothetical protein